MRWRSRLGPGLRAAVAAGLTTVVVTTERSAADDFTGAAAVLSGREASDQLSVQSCRRMLLGSQRLTAWSQLSRPQALRTNSRTRAASA